MVFGEHVSEYLAGMMCRRYFASVGVPKSHTAGVALILHFLFPSVDLLYCEVRIRYYGPERSRY